jgi:RNA polymerase sigma-70 factor, ECF subfamily
MRGVGTGLTPSIRYAMTSLTNMNPTQRAELNRCMIQLADGDRSVFQSVFELTWPLVRSYAIRMLAGAPDAEDAAQEAMVKVFSRAHEFRKDAQALPWILGIVTYECRSHLKRVSRRREDFDTESTLDQVEDGHSNPEQTVLGMDAIEAILSTLDRLSPGEREAVMASILETDRPDLEPAAFRKRLQRGLGKFRMLWRAEHDWE